MAGWHHRLDGHEFEQTPGVGDGQGGLACCNFWGRKESDMTKWLNWTELNHFQHHHTRFLSFRCRHNIIWLENISLTFGQEFLSMSCFCLENKFINAGKVSSGDFRGQGSCYGWGERRNVLFFTKKPGEERETSFRRVYISQQNRRTSTLEKKPGEKLLVLSGKMDQRTRQYNNRCWDFPCGPVVETSLSSTGIIGLIPGQRAKTPHSSWPKNQNIKYKHYSNTFKIKKKWPTWKKLLKKSDVFLFPPFQLSVKSHIFTNALVLIHHLRRVIQELCLHPDRWEVGPSQSMWSPGSRGSCVIVNCLGIHQGS